MTDHPITPPLLLVEQLLEQCLTSRELAAKAFQAGADMELEACCEWFRVKGYHPEVYRDLRDIRRPKPSLAEEARGELDRLIALISSEGALAMAEPIRRALERLQELENND